MGRDKYFQPDNKVHSFDKQIKQMQNLHLYSHGNVVLFKFKQR